MNISTKLTDGSPTREYLVVTSLDKNVRFHLPDAIPTNTPYTAAIYIRKYLIAGEYIIAISALENVRLPAEITHLLVDKKLKEYIPVTNGPEENDKLNDTVEEILSPEIVQHEEVKKVFYNTEIEEVEDDFDY